MENSLKHLPERFRKVRLHSEFLCSNLKTEDFQLQAVEFVSPPKWHLAHTTWFYETFILKNLVAGYTEFNADYNFFFNSYYESVGTRTPRPLRGLMTRPTVEEIYAYRAYVNSEMEKLFSLYDLAHQESTNAVFVSSNEQNRSEKTDVTELLVDLQEAEAFFSLTELGLHHEQQHQELLLTDLKYSFSLNPLFPQLLDIGENENESIPEKEWTEIPEGIYSIGHKAAEFCFDNEEPRHRVFLEGYQIRNQLVTNAEYLEFIKDGGYEKFNLWLSEGWSWVQQENVKSPLHWVEKESIFYHYTLNGLQKINPAAAVTHISFYEAFAYAEWAGSRLPTEEEWENANDHFAWGKRWEWTYSAYLPYPGYTHAEGALGEYNGKFMINQMVLRGSSIATPEDHSRPTYRNFFPPQLRWQFTGIRLAKKHHAR